ncbi:hypothetical protein TSOC_009735, partial [Tetrabaena socialis]
MSKVGGRLQPCLRYFQRGRTRLLAARDCNVAWLDNTHLSLVDDPNAATRRPRPILGNPAATAAAAAAAGAGGGEAGEGESELRRRMLQLALERRALSARLQQERLQQQRQELGAPPAAKVVKLESVFWLQLDGTFY